MDKTVLIVDDDRRLRDLLTEYLTPYGFQVSTLPDGTTIQRAIKERRPNIVILDIMMPRKDGLEVLREIRTDSRVPVIMLTARGEDADRIVGLELGADDYLTKPFNPRELLARMRAVLRRASEPGPGKPITGKGSLLRAGGLVLDTARRIIEVEGKEVAVCATEDADSLHISVSNTYRRLSEEELGRLFEPFYRAEDVQEGGTGLGLAITRKIIEHNGGHIRAVNAEKGIAFEIRLPKAGL